MPSKSDEIRRLLAEGKSRSEVARIVGCAYQQVYQIDVKRHAGPNDRGRPSPGVPAARPTGNISRPLAYGSLRGSNLRGRTTAAPTVPPTSGPQRIRTGPSQIRIAVQDGHEVIMVQALGGLECTNCREPIQYSIRDLAYVHTGSGAPVTRLIDLQTGDGLFDG